MRATRRFGRRFRREGAQTVEERFWSKVRIDTRPDSACPPLGPCWEWNASIRSDGYGEFSFEGRVRATHQVAYILAKGPIPVGQVVRHRCDNRLCCRPKHLILGSQKQNVDDMVSRGRNFRAVGDLNGTRRRPDRVARGEQHGNAKFTDTEVHQVKVLYHTHRWKKVEIARHLGMHEATVRDILMRRTRR